MGRPNKVKVCQTPVPVPPAQTAFPAPPRGRSSAHIFEAFYIFTIKFLKSPAHNFQTFQSGSLAQAMNNISNIF
jgi:hypothetical protein